MECVASNSKVLERRALRIEQGRDRAIYAFALKASEILKVAQVSRISRAESGQLRGYQRPEAQEHIKNIVEYLNSTAILFPNSIILAFDSRVSFVRSRGPTIGDGVGESGLIRIPMTGRPPGWIVDGQQRATALARCSRPDLPVPVNAFVGDDMSLQRDQFLRVNNTKPLPKGLITELLPQVDTVLPPTLSAKRLPSALVDVLNLDPSSPMHKLVRRASTEKDDKDTTVITGTAVMTSIEESLTTPSGCLYSYRNLATGETETDEIKQVLFLFWAAVKETFPEAWGKSPKESRLMHGAGIRAMGRVMDHVMRGVDPNAPNARQSVLRALAPLKRACRWTGGRWEDLDGMEWNEIQNVPRHIQVLSSVLVRTVLQRGGIA
jgi:DGQHR domain-containing protein